MIKFVNAVETSLRSSNWYAALTTALMLLDIAGWVENPAEGSQARFARWFDRFVGDRYRRPAGGWLPEHVFLSGNDCYALRCSLLHEGRDTIAHQRARAALERFQFIAPRPGLTVHCNQMNSKLQLQVDIFCQDICQGARAWLATILPGDDRHARLSELLQIQIGGGIAI